MGGMRSPAKTSKEPVRSCMNRSEMMTEIVWDFGIKSCCNCTPRLWEMQLFIYTVHKVDCFVMHLHLLNTAEHHKGLHL